MGRKERSRISRLNLPSSPLHPWCPADAQNLGMALGERAPICATYRGVSQHIAGQSTVFTQRVSGGQHRPMGKILCPLSYVGSYFREDPWSLMYPPQHPMVLTSCPANGCGWRSKLIEKPEAGSRQTGHSTMERAQPLGPKGPGFPSQDKATSWIK